MRYLNQKPNSSTCGQTCLAMITGYSVDEVCKLIGNRGGTRTCELVNFLEMECIVLMGRRLKRMTPKITYLPMSEHSTFPPMPKFAILHLRPAKKQKKYWGHWAVLKNGKVYDPATVYIGPTPLAVYIQGLAEIGSKITSYLELA